jgi:O-antigen/teichoic acid export membrane protein
MLLVTLLATPFVIRLLGSESYGVLALVNVLIGYLAFADVGMGLAATRFGAEAHSRGDDDNEAAIVWTSLLIAAIPAAVGAVLLASLAGPLVDRALRLPAHLHATAVMALRIGALGFFAGSITGVLNAPQFVRLRMDLSAFVGAGAAILQNSVIPTLLFLGGGLVAAVEVIAGVRIASLLAHAIISRRLQPRLLPPRIDSTLIKPLLGFGCGLVVSTLAGVILGNAEKLLLTRYSSVTALAHYSVAFTVAGLLAVVPGGMRQSLFAAFSRLQAEPERESLMRLYTRVLRGTLFWTAPAALVLCVVAKPFFTLWAGPEFGRESTVPFYILVGGLIFNVLAYIPHSLLMAFGRSDLIARVHLAELLPYVVCAATLIYWLGPVGAALAYSVRVITDALVLFTAARRTAKFRLSPVPSNRGSYAFAVGMLLLPVPLVAGAGASSTLLVIVAVLSLLAYSGVVWMRVLNDAERAWLIAMPVLRRRDLVGN